MSRFHAYLHTGSQAWYGSLLLTMSRIQVVTDVNHSSPVMFIAYSPMAEKTVQIHIQQTFQMSQFECRSTAVATSPSSPALHGALHHLHPRHFMVHYITFIPGTSWCTTSPSSPALHGALHHLHPRHFMVHYITFIPGTSWCTTSPSSPALHGAQHHLHPRHFMVHYITFIPGTSWCTTSPSSPALHGALDARTPCMLAAKQESDEKSQRVHWLSIEVVT